MQSKFMSINNKAIIKVNLTGLIVILTFLVSITSVSAVVYHYEEDFSNSISSNYIMEGMKFGIPGNPAEIIHTWNIENGELVSEGEFSATDNNLLYINDATAYGAWSFDVYLPEGVQEAPFPHRVFTFILSELLFGPNKEVEGQFFGDYHIEVSENDIALEYFNGTEYDFHAIATEPLTLRNSFNHYDFIRNQTHVFVYIDGEEIIGAEFPSSVGDTINYVNFLTPQGNGVRFDNITITDDADGLLSELNSQPTYESSSESSEDDSPIGYGGFILGIGLIVILQRKRIISW